MSYSSRTIFLTAAVTVALIFNSVAATDIVVGAPNGGWDLNTDYSTWAATQTFTVGDNLIFQYTAGSHDVLEVTKANYDSCGTSGPINTFTSGNDNVALSSAGTRYFICGIPGHCGGGMKLAVTTVAGSTPSASPPPPPTTTTPASPPPPTTTTPASPPPTTTTPPSTTGTPPPFTSPIPGKEPPPPTSAAVGVLKAKVASGVGLLGVLAALLALVV